MAHEQGENDERISRGFLPFRKPDKFKTGDDFQLFTKRMDLFFAAADVRSTVQKRVSILLNLSEDCFRIAESVSLDDESEEGFKAYMEKLILLFERNQNPVERRFNFSRRVQLPGESVDNFAIALRELASKCSFSINEVNGRLNDQFIAGVTDKSLQCKLLQDPLASLEESLVVARRYEAAKSAQATITENVVARQEIKTVTTGKECFNCHEVGHLAKNCRFNDSRGQGPTGAAPNTYLCFNCGRKGHLARFCRFPKQEVMYQDSRRRAIPDKSKLCYVCDKPGHVARNCLVKQRLLAEQREIKHAAGTQHEKQSALSTVKPIDNRSALVLTGEIGGRIWPCLIDTGSPINLLDSRVLSAINGVTMEPNDMVAKAANGQALAMIGKVFLDIKIKDKVFHLPFYVVENLQPEILLGLTWMIDNGIIIDFTQQKLCYPDGGTVDIKFQYARETDCLPVVLKEDVVVPGHHEVIAPGAIEGSFCSDRMLEPNPDCAEKGVLIARVVVSPVSTVVPIQLINPGNENVKLYKGTKIGTMEHIMDERADYPVKKADNDQGYLEDVLHELQLPSTLSSEEEKMLKTLLGEFKDTFSLNPTDIGRTNLAKHSINTGMSQPINQPPRRLPFALKDVVDNQVQELLAKEMIEESNSPWSSPVVLVRKKSGEWRFCVDYRRLNDCTVKDAFPLPRIDDIMDSLQGQKYFSSLDLTSGYWQVEMDKDSAEKTAFSVPTGHFEWKVMPFGLCNAVATFQRLMSRVLAGKIGKHVFAYLDDVLIAGVDFKEHISLLRDVFNAFRQANLKLNLKKCVFAQTSVEYLGFLVNGNGIQPSPTKVQSIVDYPAPTNVDELRRFIGLVSFYRRFISGSVDLMSPLNKLLQKGIKWNWNDACINSFHELKRQLAEKPLLHYPDFSQPFVMYCDASDRGVGVVLSQKIEDEEHVIAYASKSFTKSELHWSVTEKEAFALVWGLTHFHAYVYGNKVIIYSDHRALHWLRKMKEPTGKLARWILRLEEYNYEVIHKPGKLMAHVDALSRQTPVKAIFVSGFWTKDDFVAAQKQDYAISLVQNWLRNGQKPDKVPENADSTLKTLYLIYDKLLLDDDLLFRFWFDSTGEEVKQIVVPAILRLEVLQKVHTSIGHMGIKKTFNAIQDQFYWPRFYNDTELFVNSCPVCLRNKEVPRPRYPLKPIEVVPIPFYMIGMDIIGPMKVTTRNNRYILSVIDYFTKFGEAVALPDAKSETISRVLEEIFARHGMPTVLLSDQGSNMESHVIKSVCKLFNIEKRHTTAYHPQCDGLVEKFNGTIKTLLRTCLDRDRNSQWDEHLNFALLASRVTKNESTGFSPFELLYGRPPRLPTFVQPDNQPMFWSPAEEQKYIANLRRRTEILQEKTAENIQAAQAHQKRNYDIRYRADRAKDLKVGDFVLIKNNRARGLDPKYLGPFQIIRRFGEDFKVRCQNSDKEKIVHYNRLKYFAPGLIENNIQMSSDSEDDISNSDEALDSYPVVFQRPNVHEPVYQNIRRSGRTRRRPEFYGQPVPSDLI